MIVNKPDEGWAWIVLIAAIGINIISLGMVFSFGIYNVTFMEIFSENKAITASIVATNMGLTFICGPIASTCTRRYGFRPIIITGGLLTFIGFLTSMFAQTVYHLIITFGIISGIGLGLTYVPSVGVLVYYFKKWRIFATAFTSTGSGLGAFVFSLLFQYLITEYGWRGSLLIISGISLNLVVFGALIRPVEKTGNNIKLSQMFRTDLFKEIKFNAFLLHFFFMHGIFSYLSMVNVYVINKGVADDQSSYVVAMYGCFSLLSRCCVTVLSGRVSLERYLFHIQFVSTLAFAAFIFFFVLTRNLTVYVFLSSCIGFFFGIKFALLPAWMIKLFKADRLTSVLGYATMLGGLSNILGPIITISISHFFGNKNAGFLFIGSYCTLSFIFLLIVFITNRHSKNNFKEEKEVNQQMLSKDEQNKQITVEA